jgi:hypothetical protein
MNFIKTLSKAISLKHSKISLKALLDIALYVTCFKSRIDTMGIFLLTLMDI